MKEEDILVLKQLISSLKVRLNANESLNDIQKEFIDELESPTIDINKLNTLLKNDTIKENTNLKFKKKQKLSKDQWSSIIEEKEQNSETSDQLDVDTLDQKSSIIPEAVIYYDIEFHDAKIDIEFQMRFPEAPVPVEIGAFIRNVHEVQEALKELYKDEKDKARLTIHMESLVGIAEIGAASTLFELARQQLEQFKSEIILQKGREIKRTYLVYLGISGISVSLVCFILLILPNIFNIKMDDESIFKNGIYLIIGSCIGTWLSFAVRKKELNFEDLRTLNDGFVSPMLRMIVLVLIGLSFYFMFITNFLNVAIGETFSTGYIGEKGYESLAFVIGIFIGLAENTIGPTLTSRIETFTSKL
ncbi:MAG: hypothetical protein ABJJ25_15350 [Eudoraea sp.]|uniref:hypothetical protein n=1 Tax=Eudoraea sp. TaxID=1979955 RepID=UPI0032637124